MSIFRPDARSQAPLETQLASRTWVECYITSALSTFTSALSTFQRGDNMVLLM
jgi:hypothetical protein